MPWFMTFYKSFCLVRNHCLLDLMKWIDLLRLMMGLDICYYLALQNMMPFTRELDIL